MGYRLSVIGTSGVVCKASTPFLLLANQDSELRITNYELRSAIDGEIPLPSKIQPRVPRGMRDILPQKMLQHQSVIGTIEKIFQRFGFEPHQTPVLELSDALMDTRAIEYGGTSEKIATSDAGYSAMEERQMYDDYDQTAFSPFAGR